MKKPAGKGSRRHLDPDDSALWEHTAQTVSPLKRGKPRVHAATETLKDVPAKAAKATKTERAEKLGTVAKAQSPPPPPALPAPPVKKPPIAEFDRKAARKIRSGQVQIDARIDLHGMRQDEAHAVLAGFLRRSQGKGHRWVLVITGKGRANDDDHAPFDMTATRDRGVLKRNVPRWLEEPDLRMLVVSYTTAAPQHGGEGALYVHLRKRG